MTYLSTILNTKMLLFCDIVTSKLFGENADIKAAKNILAVGLAVFTCGEYGVSQPMKQESTMSRVQASECAWLESPCFSKGRMPNKE